MKPKGKKLFFGPQARNEIGKIIFKTGQGKAREGVGEWFATSMDYSGANLITKGSVK